MLRTGNSKGLLLRPLCRSLASKASSSSSQPGSSGSSGSTSPPSSSSSSSSLPPPTDCDLVGPPDRLSHLRPVRLFAPPDESPLRRRLRHLRRETQEWNQQFWATHNRDFAEEKDEFVQKVVKSREGRAVSQKTLTSEEMSEFYRDFLNRKRADHVSYNVEWQKRNAKIVWLSLRAVLEDVFVEKKNK